MANELAPTFLVQPFFDGDDDIKQQTGNFIDALVSALTGLENEGYCIGFIMKEMENA